MEETGRFIFTDQVVDTIFQNLHSSLESRAWVDAYRKMHLFRRNRKSKKCDDRIDIENSNSGPNFNWWWKPRASFHPQPQCRAADIEVGCGLASSKVTLRCKTM